MLELNNTFENFVSAFFSFLNGLLQTMFTNLADIFNAVRVF